MPRLGQYEIVAELGRGGMGVVFRGFDPLIGRDVAIKTIRLFDVADAAERRYMQQRLEREAQSAGRLSHPNIVTIYQIGYDVLEPNQHVAFIVMEYVAGPTLAQQMSSGPPLDRGSILNILSQTAEALDYAHSQGVVHRDVKPANLLLSPDHRVKVTDFGIAKVSANTMTQTGAMVGSPYYMAPEQVRAEPVDGRADQYALGVLAYELLSGRRPYQADSFSALVYQVAHEEMPTEALLRAGIPASAVQVLRRAMAKRPEHRFGSCREMVGAIAHALQATYIAPAVPAATAATGALASTPALYKGWSMSWLLGLAVPLLLVGGAVVWRHRTVAPAPPSVSEASVATPRPAAASRKAERQRPVPQTRRVAAAPAPTVSAPPQEETPSPAPEPVTKAVPLPEPATPTQPDPVPPPLVRTPPEVIRKVNPVYTESARLAGIQGSVAYRVHVDASGVPAKLDLVRGLDPGLDRNAAGAIAQWRFSPATEGGQPVTWSGIVEVEFRLVNGPGTRPPSLRSGSRPAK